MSFLGSIRGVLGSGSKPADTDLARQILVFGDSHVHAIQEAIKRRADAGNPVAIDARRLLKPKKKHGAAEVLDVPQEDMAGPWYSRRKNGRGARRGASGAGAAANDVARLPTIGDTTLEDFLAIGATLKPDDVIVSVIGGNQHAVVSTIQHPDRFDFILPGDEDRPLDPDAQLIPYRALYDYFESGIRQRDGKTLAALREGTSARIVHLASPPPKASNAFIKDYHDTQFATQGIAELGVSRAELRLKFWRLQNIALKVVCDELDIELLPPPPTSCDKKGFLARPYYARDATHSNAEYGELVLLQLEDRLSLTATGTKDDDHASV